MGAPDDLLLRANEFYTTSFWKVQICLRSMFNVEAVTALNTARGVKSELDGEIVDPVAFYEMVLHYQYRSQSRSKGGNPRFLLL